MTPSPRPPSNRGKKRVEGVGTFWHPWAPAGPRDRQKLLRMTKRSQGSCPDLWGSSLQKHHDAGGPEKNRSIEERGRSRIAASCSCSPVLGLWGGPLVATNSGSPSKLDHGQRAPQERSGGRCFLTGAWNTSRTSSAWKKSRRPASSLCLASGGRFRVRDRQKTSEDPVRGERSRGPRLEEAGPPDIWEPRPPMS